jgi:hypothetical protein
MVRLLLSIRLWRRIVELDIFMSSAECSSQELLEGKPGLTPAGARPQRLAPMRLEVGNSASHRKTAMPRSLGKREHAHIGKRSDSGPDACLHS